jgi:hypothetical protein
MKQTKLEKLEDRVAELEKYNTAHGRPPTRLGNCLRYLIENMDTIREIVANHKSATS